MSILENVLETLGEITEIAVENNSGYPYFPSQTLVIGHNVRWDNGEYIFFYDTKLRDFVAGIVYHEESARLFIFSKPEYEENFRKDMLHVYETERVIKLTEFSDLFDKLIQVKDGKVDELVNIYLDISDEEFLVIAKAAHAQDITFNQFFVNLLTELVENEKK